MAGGVGLGERMLPLALALVAPGDNGPSMMIVDRSVEVWGRRHVLAIKGGAGSVGLVDLRCGE